MSKSNRYRKSSKSKNNFIFLIFILVLAAIFYVLILKPENTRKRSENFLSGENAYMEPEFNYYFNKCLQSYPIAFRGPINDGYYTCLRKTEAALKGLGQGCEFCYNKDS